MHIDRAQAPARGLADLPLDLIAQVLSHLRPHEIARAAAVSRGLAAAAREPAAWAGHMGRADAVGMRRWEGLPAPQRWRRAAGVDCGEARWSRLALPSLPWPEGEMCTAVALNVGRLAVGTTGGELAAIDLDAAPARLMWRRRRHRCCIRHLESAGRAADAPWVTLGCDSTVKVWAAADGALLWDHACLRAPRQVAFDPISGGQLVLAEGGRRLACLGPLTAPWAAARRELSALSAAQPAGATVTALAVDDGWLAVGAGESIVVGPLAEDVAAPPQPVRVLHAVDSLALSGHLLVAGGRARGGQLTFSVHDLAAHTTRAVALAGGVPEAVWCCRQVGVVACRGGAVVALDLGDPELAPTQRVGALAASVATAWPQVAAGRAWVMVNTAAGCQVAWAPLPWRAGPPRWTALPAAWASDAAACADTLALLEAASAGEAPGATSLAAWRISRPAGRGPSTAPTAAAEG